MHGLGKPARSLGRQSARPNAPSSRPLLARGSGRRPRRPRDLEAAVADVHDGERNLAGRRHCSDCPCSERKPAVRRRSITWPHQRRGSGVPQHVAPGVAQTRAPCQPGRCAARSLGRRVKLRPGGAPLLATVLKTFDCEAYCDSLTPALRVTAGLGPQYEPTLVSGTYKVTQEQRLALLFIGYVLGQVQCPPPSAGAIVGLDGRVHKVLLAQRRSTGCSPRCAAGHRRRRLRPRGEQAVRRRRRSQSSGSGSCDETGRSMQLRHGPAVGSPGARARVDRARSQGRSVPGGSARIARWSRSTARAAAPCRR